MKKPAGNPGRFFLYREIFRAETAEEILVGVFV
jgi:hypothetical protein